MSMATRSAATSPLAAAILICMSLPGGCERTRDDMGKTLQTDHRPEVLVRLGAGTLGLVTSERRYCVWNVSGDPRLVREMALVGNMRHAMPISDTLVAQDLYTDDPEADSIVVVDLTSGQPRYTCELGKGAEVVAIAADIRGEALAWVEEQVHNPLSFRMRCVDVQTGKVKCDLEAPLVAPRYQRIGCLAFSPDGKTIAFASSEGKGAAGAVDIDSNVVLWHRVTEPWGGIWRIAFCPDSESFYATDDCGQLTRYETKTGKVLWRTEVKLPAYTPWGDQARERLLALDVSPDGKHVAVGTDYTKKVMIWEVSSGKRVGKIKVSKWPVESILLFSHDGKGIWAAGSQDRRIRYFALP